MNDANPSANRTDAGPQFSTRPGGAQSTFSADRPNDLHPGPTAEELNPNGNITDRPDVSYNARRAEEDRKVDADRRAHLDRAIAQAPIAPGMLFNFPAVAGQGAAFRIEGMGDGTMAITLSPDGALPVSVRLSGLDLARFRRAVWDGKPDLG